MSAFILHRLLNRGEHSRRGPMGALLLVLTGLLAACGGGGGGGGGGGSPPPPTVTLSSIAVTAASASFALGTTDQLTATGTYSDNTKKDLTSQVTWAATTAGIVSISAAGLATSKGVGQTAITASMSGVTGNGTLTVTAATLTSIAVATTTPSVTAGLTAQFTATGTYSDGTKPDISSKVIWASATTAVATINASGLATALTPGTSAITAMLSGVTGSATLTVTAATLVSIAITPAHPTIAPGKTVQFTATGTYSNATTTDLTTTVAWSSTNSAVAVIGGGTGLASATGTAGMTMIQAAYTGVTITPATLNVNGTVYAYATNFAAGTVSQYSISAGGALTALNPTTVAAGASPFSVSVEPTGQYVYVANYNAATVSQYTIGTGGVLAPVGTGSVPTGSHPNGVTIDPSNKYAYVVNFGSNTVSQYTIDTTGALAPLSTPTVATGSFPASIVLSPNNKYAYVSNYACSGIGCTAAQGSVSQYTVGADGSLTPMTPATVNTGSATSQPNSLIVDPTSAFLYVANAGDSTVSLFTIGASGALTPTGTPIATGTFPFFVTVDPSGTHVYVANTGSAAGYTAAGSISQYSITAGTGVLVPIGTGSVPAGLGTSSVTVDPTGAYAYATNRGESSLSQYTIGAGGALTPMATPTVAAGLNPTSIATGY
jgi:6-phosphogluconolactonase (cycloisomerase 2 family)